jgi:hypothetical protein
VVAKKYAIIAFIAKQFGRGPPKKTCDAKPHCNAVIAINNSNNAKLQNL